MSELERLINRHHNTLNENELAIVAYILENPKMCGNLSIVKLATKCHTSKSSIHRLTKKLGMAGFAELKYHLKHTEESVISDCDLLELQVEDIEATLKLMRTSDVKSIVKEMRKAKRIFGFGTGWGQQNALVELNRNLLRTGRHMLIIPAKTEFDLLMDTFTEGDFIIIISLSGDTPQLEKNIQLLNLRNVGILSITTFKNNYLAQKVPYNLYYQTTPLLHKKEHDILSFITLNVLCDALFREYLAHIP